MRSASRQEGPGGARQHAETSGQGNVVVQIVGDGNSVVVGYAYLTLTRFLNRRVARGQEQPRSEAAILSPYALSVPLVGREAVLAELWEWMGGGRPVSVRVMTAAAGAGKTRLALELCDQAVQAGWDAGFLAEGELVRFLSARNLAAWGWRRRTLIVVDYAASRARDLRAWLVELADHSGQEGKPLRLLLLERHAEPSWGWWREAFGYGGGDAEAVGLLLDPASGPYVLPPLVSPRERRAVLSSILERIGSRVRPPELDAAPGFERQLAAMSWGGEPLFLLMAGLIADRAGFGAVLALSGTDLGQRIAGHEIGRIEGLARSHRIPESFLAHLAAYITLCQGLPQAEVEALVEQEKDALRYPSAGDPPTIYEALAAALPGESGAVAPVLPDVIGEAVVLKALGGGTPEKALAAVARAARQATERVTASLIHLAQDYGAVRPEPLAWFERVAGEAATSLVSLETVLTQLPDSTLVLRELAESLERRAVELIISALLLDTTSQAPARAPSAVAQNQADRAGLAVHLNNLSKRLSDLGRREDALAAGEEAVAQYRELAAARPDASALLRPALAGSLSDLCVRLSGLGRREEALAAIEEAVAEYRELAASRPDAFRPELARSLNNLSLCLRELGRREEALAASDEAVARYRELAASQPNAFRHELATSLNNLSNRLSDLGRREEALAASDEAVAQNRELAASRPDAFGPDLASSLNNLSNHLSDLGRSEEALAASEAALMQYRELAASRPDAFRSNLAQSLNTLSNSLGNLGRTEEALAAINEAVAQYRKLVAAGPEAFRPYLAGGLYNLSRTLNALGRKEEAVAAINEAVVIHRELVRSRPDAHLPDLAMALSNLSYCLSDLGRREEALAAIEEAVALYRELAAAHPDAFGPDLARWLINMSNCLSDLERREEALAAIKEAVARYRELGGSRPDAFRPSLATSLHNLSVRLCDLGRREEALAASDEAVRILAPYFLTDPAAFQAWMDLMVKKYILIAKEAGQEPDAELLRPILSRLERPASEPDTAGSAS